MDNNLEEKIESVRKKLIMMVETEGFSSMDTIIVSKELDCLLNMFNTLKTITK